MVSGTTRADRRGGQIFGTITVRLVCWCDCRLISSTLPFLMLLLHEELAFRLSEDDLWFLLPLRLIVPKFVPQQLRLVVQSLQIVPERYHPPTV